MCGSIAYKLIVLLKKLDLKSLNQKSTIDEWGVGGGGVALFFNPNTTKYVFGATHKNMPIHVFRQCNKKLNAKFHFLFSRSRCKIDKLNDHNSSLQ